MNILNKVAAVFRRKAANPGLAPVIGSSIGNSVGIIRDWLPGVWQRGLPPLHAHDAYDNSAIYACISRLAGDFSLMPPRVQKKQGRIWVEDFPGNSFLNMPNTFETPTLFWEHWIISLLTYGNAFIYMRSDAWFILNPTRVRVLVALDGSGKLYYECGEDLQCGITQSVILDSSVIIHGRINSHIGKNPALGCPPVMAAALAAQLGADAKAAAESIYANSAMPGGIIQVPGAVDASKLKDIKSNWETGYSNGNRGRTAVLSDGMEFKAYESANLVDSELIAALRLSAEQVAAIFGIPGYKVGAGSFPAYAGQSQADQAYLNGTIQRYIALTEGLLNNALGYFGKRRVNFDTSPLLRMDMQAQVNVLGSAVANALMSPNEAREMLNLPPVDGGEYPLSQQQYFSLPALAKRDASSDPTGSEPAATQPEPAATQDEPTPEELAAAAKAVIPDDISEGGKLFLKSLEPARWQAKWDGVYWQKYFKNDPSGELSCHWIKKREQPPLEPTLEPEITAWAEVRPTTHLMPRSDPEFNPEIADYLHDVNYLHHVEEEIEELMNG